MLHLKRAKTDRIDAALIAAATQLLDGQDRMAADPRFEALADHLTFIEQIEEDIVRFKTRLEHITDKRLHRIMQANIRREQMRRLVELKRLGAELRTHADLAKRITLVLSVPGSGNALRWPSWCGCPSWARSAANRRRLSRGWHRLSSKAASSRGRCISAAAESDRGAHCSPPHCPPPITGNPALVALRTRMVGRGKSHTSTMIACARKLLIFANTVVIRGTPWQVGAHA